jgi:hypothetical protein
MEEIVHFRRPETGDRRPETGDRRPETGDSKIINIMDDRLKNLSEKVNPFIPCDDNVTFWGTKLL